MPIPTTDAVTTADIATVNVVDGFYDEEDP